jgi:hypothetical protein
MNPTRHAQSRPAGRVTATGTRGFRTAARKPFSGFDGCARHARPDRLDGVASPLSELGARACYRWADGDGP